MLISLTCCHLAARFATNHVGEEANQGVAHKGGAVDPD